MVNIIRQSFFDGEGNSMRLSGNVITVTTASELEKEVLKRMREGNMNSIEYVTTAPSSDCIELSMREEPVEETEVTKAKIEVKKKVDSKNWLKASDKPWERNKKGIFK